MKKISIIIFILLLFGCVYILVYWFVYKDKISQQNPQNTATETLFQEESKTTQVENISLSGKIKQITENSLIVTSQEGDLEILINKESEFIITALTKGEDGLFRLVGEKIDFKDVREGDDAAVSAKQKDEEITGISILIFP